MEQKKQAKGYSKKGNYKTKATANLAIEITNKAWRWKGLSSYLHIGSISVRMSYRVEDERIIT